MISTRYRMRAPTFALAAMATLAGLAGHALADEIVWIRGPGDRHQSIIIKDIKTAVGPGGTTGYEFVDQFGEALAFMSTDGTDPFGHTSVTEFFFTPAFDELLIEPISMVPMTLTYSDGEVTDDGTGHLYAAGGAKMATLGFEFMGAAGDPVDGSIMFNMFPPENQRTLTIRSGRCDCYALGAEAASPSPELATFITSINPNPGPATFDDTDQNEWFGHTFKDLPMGCIVGGTLTITAKPLGFSENDAFWLGQVGDSSTTLATHFTGWSYGDRVSGGPTLFPGERWSFLVRPEDCGYTTVIDLDTTVGTSTDTLIDRMNALGVLDVYSQDDTSIDCLVLELDVDPDCDPLCNPCPGDFDGDGQLTIFDFLAFQSAFAMGCP